MIEKNKSIIVYQEHNRSLSIEVKVDNETIWMTQKQIAELFETERSVITKHINNIFKTEELNKNSVCAKFAHTASDGKEYQSNFYNLDVIISVGYRVNSIKGTQFRIWATNILREKILAKKLKKELSEPEINNLVHYIARIIDGKELTGDEAQGLLKVIVDYQYALEILDKYDHNKLDYGEIQLATHFRLTYEDAIEAIKVLKKKYGGSSLFGKEKDQSFSSSINTIYQTFDGEELYPSIEEKAAHLLYFVTKNHSFVDGNKRIAALLFTLFLNKNKYLYDNLGNLRLANNTLVALTLMIAESKPKDKEMIIKVVINLIDKNN